MFTQDKQLVIQDKQLIMFTQDKQLVIQDKQTYYR